MSYLPEYLSNQSHRSNGIVADLHIHTTSSDGKRSPYEIVEMAVQRRLSAIAITDHDSIGGIDEAVEASLGKNIEIIPGIEISAEDDNRSIHVLGYYIDHHNPAFAELLSDIIEHRTKRAEKMILKLNELGVELTLQDVRRFSKTEFLGRVHIAQAMVEKGYISDIKEAFSIHYIGKGGLAYVNRYKMSVHEAIAIIHDAGGWASIAHPGNYDGNVPLDEKDFQKFMKSGLDGIEVFTFKHNRVKSIYYQGLAEKLGLIITGGSDYHGKHNLNVGDYGLSKPYFTEFKHRVKEERRASNKDL